MNRRSHARASATFSVDWEARSAKRRTSRQTCRLKSGGLLIRGSEVRILPGACEVPGNRTKPMSSNVRVLGNEVHRVVLLSESHVEVRIPYGPSCSLLANEFRSKKPNPTAREYGGVQLVGARVGAQIARHSSSGVSRRRTALRSNRSPRRSPCARTTRDSAGAGPDRQHDAPQRPPSLTRVRCRRPTA